MAYQAKRKKLYEEEFQLTEEDGTVIHTLKVSLDADNMVRKISEKHVALVKAMQDMNKINQDIKEVRAVQNAEEGLTVLGNAVVDILEAVFGKEDTEIILEFYNNRYVEMCQEVVPFITKVVIPEVRKIAKDNKQQVLSQYNRKQRRTFLKGKRK